MLSGLLRLCALACVIGSTAGCENPEPAVGLRRDGSGVIVMVNPCRDGAVVFSLELREIPSGRVVWAVESDGVTEREFRLFTRPEGFEVTTSNESSLDSGSRYELVYGTSELREAEEYFSSDEVPDDGTVFVPRRGTFPVDAFWARSTCD